MNKPKRAAIGSLGTSCFEGAKRVEVDAGEVGTCRSWKRSLPSLWEPPQGQPGVRDGGGAGTAAADLKVG